MEIKNKTKSILKNPLKIMSIILSIAITSFIIIEFSIYLKRFKLKITTAFAIIILICMGINILYKYIYSILKMVKKKKIVIPILMFLLVIFFIVGIFYIKSNVNYILRNSIILLIYILGIICIPMIILGFSIINESKFKITKILISLLLLIYIYTINMNLLVISAKMIITNLANHSIYELLEKENENNTNLTYLEEYAQKFAKNSYLKKYDIIQILDLTDNKSKEIEIYYRDEEANIYIETTNKNDEEMKNLKNILKAEYYKYYYEKDNTEQIKIYIERYLLDQELNQEKNEDIILKGIENTEIIENVNKYGINENSDIFCFTNKMQINSKNDIKEIYKFNLLFSYNQESQNYIPVVEDIQDYEFIESYKVYNQGIEITLKKGVEIMNTDYTLRINRYDNELQIKDREINNNIYYYNYEPVVTKMEGYENRIVLEMKFDRNYTIEELKNIEIIFGN